jgi:hypothetical protein
VVRVLSADRPEVATPPDLAAARLAGEQNACVTTRQLAALGISAGALTRRVRRGQLHRVHRGVYAVVVRELLTLKGTLTAAALACGAGAVLSDFAAAAWHAMLPWEDGRRPDVIVPRSGGRGVDAVRAHRSTSLDPRRDVWRRDGVLVASPARTVLDLAGRMAPPALRRMVRRSFAEGVVSVRQLHDVLARSPRHRGAPALRALLADGHVPSRSELEDRALDVLARAGLPAPEVNPRLLLDERRIHPDLLWRGAGLAVELDGLAWHHDPLTRRDDADRQAILEAHGLHVLRLSWRQLVDRPGQSVARIRRALAPTAEAPPPRCG